jgi:hypothetical protein
VGSDYRCTIRAPEVNCKCIGFTFTWSCVQHSEHNSKQTAANNMYPIFPSITRALSIQKRSVNEKTDNVRYAMKIEKIPNYLHTYAHNNLKQCILRK